MNREELVRDLGCVHGLMVASVEAGIDKDDAMKSMYNSWARRLESIPRLVGDDAQHILAAITAGPWSTTQRKELASKLMENQEELALSVKTSRRKMQQCLNFENAIPTREWSKIRGVGVITATIISVLGLRAWLIGIECASEKTLQRMVAILALCTGTNYDQAEIDNIKIQLQCAIKSHGTKRPAGVKIPYIIQYPVSASDYPTSILNYAYDGQPLPVDVCFPELDTILGTAKCRTPKEPSWMQHIPDHIKQLVKASMANGGGQVQPERPQPREIGLSYGANTSAFSRNAQLRLEHQPYNAPSSGHRSDEAESRRALIKPSRSLPAITCDASSDDEDDEDQNGTLEDMEAQLLKGVEARANAKLARNNKDDIAPTSSGVFKKPAGNKLPSGGTGVQKKPAAKACGPKVTTKNAAKVGPSLLKRPAANKSGSHKKIPDMEDIFGELRMSFNHVSKGAFKTKAYKRAERRMLNAGFSEAESSEFARAQHKLACELWNELSKAES